MARNGKSSACIGVFERSRPILTVKPAFQEAREETVASTQNIEDVDRETLPSWPSSRLSGIAPSNATAPLAPRLQTSVAAETARQP